MGTLLVIVLLLGVHGDLYAQFCDPMPLLFANKDFDGTAARLTNVCTGDRVVAGNTFSVGLYVAPPGVSDESQFVLQPPTIGFSSPGVFSGRTRGIPGPSPRLVQIRVWESAYGSTYEEAQFQGAISGRLALTGKSQSIAVTLVGDCFSFQLVSDGGLTSFPIGLPECASPGSVWFENSATGLVTNLCTGEAIYPGTNFLAALYYAKAGTTDESLFTQTGPAIGFGPGPGQLQGGVRVPPADQIAPGEAGLFQVRVWEASYGSTYEQAVAAPLQGGRKALVGKSGIVQAVTSLPGSAPASLTSNGLQAFFIGYPDCVIPGSVLFQNNPSVLVTNLCTGEPMRAGTNFLAALYVGPDGATNENLFVQLGAPAGFGPEPGRFHGGIRIATGVALPGQFAMFQTRVWESAFGTNYEGAISAPPRNGRRALTGTSTIVRVQTMGNGLPLTAPIEAGNSTQPFYVGFPDCNPPGSVLFENSLSTLVSNACTGQGIVVGTNFMAALFYAPAGVSNDAFFVQLGEPASIGPEAGRVEGGPRVTPASTPPGAPAMFQMRIWESAFGSNYEQAVAVVGQGGRAALSGKSQLIQMTTQPTGGSGPSPSLATSGFQGFNIGYPLYELPMENTSTSRVLSACTSLTIPAGGDFLAALYYAPGVVTNESLYKKIGPATGFQPDGRFQGGLRALPVPLFPGETANLQIRVWEASFGGSYEEALASPPYFGHRALTGESPVVRLTNKGECPGLVESVSLARAGLQSFSVGGSCDDNRASFDRMDIAFAASENWVQGGAGDVNGDGLGDAVILGRNAHVLIGHGDGTFSVDPQGAFSFGTNNPMTIAVADFNGDGKADMAGLFIDSQEIRVYLGRGDGTFEEPISTHLDFLPTDLVCSDFDADGNTDIVVGSYNNSFVALLRGDGHGHLAPAIYSALPFRPLNVRAGTFQNDCFPDLVITRSDTNDLMIVANSGTNFFLTTGTIQLPYHADDLAVGDWNGDGRSDLVAVSFWLDLITVFLSRDANPGLPVALSSFRGRGLAPGYFMVGDFNADHRPDIFYGDRALYWTEYGGQTWFSIFTNRTEWPKLANDSVTIAEDTPALIDVLANDDRAGVPLVIRAIGQPSHGSISVSGGTNVLYTPATNFFGSDSFEYSIAGCDPNSSNTARVAITILPVNDAPIVQATAISTTVIFSNVSSVILIATNKSSSWVTLDGSGSYDVELDPLQFTWFEGGITNAIASGTQVTRLFALGNHTIILSVSDGQAVSQAVMLMQIVTPCQAVEMLASSLNEGNLSARSVTPLLTSLDAACSSFDRGNVHSGANQLEAFQAKLREQVAPVNPALAAVLSERAERIAKVMGAR